MTMKILQPVIWTKGTFLTPQHLQAQDQFLEGLLQFRTELLQFRPWGFDALEFDREALAGGTVALTAARGFFPDGLAFDIPASDLAPPPKMVSHFFSGDITELHISLAIPPIVQGGMNVSLEGRGIETRYLAEIHSMRDENTGLSEKPIQLARKNLSLLMDNEAREGTPAIEVARIRKLQDGTLDYAQEFVPPLVNLHASPLLAGMLRRLIEILVARCETLSGVRRRKNRSLADFTAMEVANFWLLYTMNTYLPQIRHLAESPRAHPSALFSVLNALAGALTTFSSDVQPHQLPAYDHKDLGRCFLKLEGQLLKMLDTVVPSYVVSLPLKLMQGSVYGTALDEERLLVNTKMFLALKSSIPEDELISRAPQLVKVCSAAHIDHLIRQALPGVALRHQPSPPASIPLKLDYQYFSLNESGGAWESIVRSRNFAAYVPSDMPEPQMELVILLPEAR